MTLAVEAKVRASFAAQTLMHTFGARLTDLGPGTCRIEAPISEGARQQMGFAHAGLVFSLGDTAAGYAALTLLPERDEVVTAEIKINLLSPATGTRLIAEGRVLKPGRRLIVVTADVFSETDGDPAHGPAGRRHVAVLQGTMMPISTRD